MTYFIATDHAGFNIKEHIKAFVRQKGHEIVDLGVHENERVDYPDYAHELCEQVLKTPDSAGILVCGTGIGMSISANRHKGIRAALCHDAYTAKLTRQHNDANILCMGERVVGLGVVDSILEAFLDTSFEGGRHACRIGKIERE
ncbi:MAG: ribose 5-phosphate isomerase B [Wolinella sp.]